MKEFIIILLSATPAILACAAIFRWCKKIEKEIEEEEKQNKKTPVIT